jgi:hypothetical protein
MIKCDEATKRRYAAACWEKVADNVLRYDRQRDTNCNQCVQKKNEAL